MPVTKKTPPPSATAPPRLLTSRNYLSWLATDSATAFGSALHSFSVPLLALYITGSPAQAGLIAGIGHVGRMLTTIPGGVVTDTINRRTLMVVGGILGLAIAGILTAFELAGLLGFWLLTTLNLLMCMRNGFFGAASNAALKHVVSESQVGPAMAANQGRDAVIALSGSPVGGILMGIGRAVPFAASALSNAVGIVAALLIRTDLRPATQLAGKAPKPMTTGSGHRAGIQAAIASFADEAMTGMKWLLHRKELRGILALSAIINLGMNAALTAVIFGLQQRGESPASIGLVSAGIGVGMLLGSFIAWTAVDI